MIPEIAGTVPDAEQFAKTREALRLMIPEIAGTVPFLWGEVLEAFDSAS